MNLRPLSDWLLVELEPQEKKYGDIFLVADDAIRTAKVIAVGPGRLFRDKTVPVPTVVKAGERVAFFIAGAQTKQGKQLNYSMPENQILIRETDVLLVIEGNVRVTP